LLYIYIYHIFIEVTVSSLFTKECIHAYCSVICVASYIYNEVIIHVVALIFTFCIKKSSIEGDGHKFDG